ncbi:ATP-binding protein [Armatimonas sp.]|uniref:sensor histidine kinase n=1 Tax=Armatimonas sp. TaxID=1872638 RepID=UPI00286D6564|nr:ATP-binding protein [Armatimonas sp.]
MSVRLRLTLLNMLVFALALGVFGAMVRVQVQTKLMDSIDYQLHHERTGRTGRRPSNGFTLEELRDKFVEARSYDAEMPTWTFYLATGANALDGITPLLDTDDFRQCVETGKPVWNTRGDKRIATFKTKTSGGPDIYAQRSESLAPMNSELSRLNRTMMTMIPIALLIAGAGGMFLTGRALAPVRQITEAAARIGVEDLSERMPVRGKDEFARLSQTFNGMLGRLEASFDRQKRFVADASHELKTPLTVIKANSSLALADPDLTPDYRETLVEIDRAADRTSRIVQDLLLLARTDHAQLSLKESEVSLANLFAEVVSEAKKLHPEGAFIDLQVAQESVWGDSHLLHRLLLNVLDNALRHTPADGKVRVVAQPSGFMVVDTGEGVSPEHLAHLGERFYRVDSARARRGGGTGLGLAISRAIAEAHGGTLALESEQGKGTTVHVTLAAHTRA